MIQDLKSKNSTRSKYFTLGIKTIKKGAKIQSLLKELKYVGF